MYRRTECLRDRFTATFKNRLSEADVAIDKNYQHIRDVPNVHVYPSFVYGVTW